MNLARYTELRREVETDYGRFAYAEVGEGAPALFVHGLFVSGYLWREVIEDLAGERRCIAYNLPAHGHSVVAADQDLSLGAQAQMLAAFCDALELGPVDLVANDTGGAIAQAFAAHYPARVRTLCLTNCEARDVLPSPKEYAQMIASLAAQGELAPVAVQMLSDGELARSEVGLGAALERPDGLSDEDIRRLPRASLLES